jgi:hypothetical protein
MIALVLAAGLAASSNSILLPPRACNAGMLQTSADPALLMRPQDWRSARPRKLGDLPPAKAEYAVVRMVGGCMVPAPARYSFRSK